MARSIRAKPLTPLGTGQRMPPKMAIPGVLGAVEGLGGTGSHDAVLRRLTERQFQAMVRAGLEQRGYVVFVFPTMKLTRAGWPDLTFWHPDRPGRLYVWELKRQCDSRVRPEQARVIAFLQTIPGIDAQIVRPLDWDGLKDSL